ncbi:MAG: hypothetical protein ACI8ZX_003140 [Planctomycetota bacterium]|jgi:hypothetical protein
MNDNLCKICKKTILGRLDKIFCSSSCKNIYHKGLRKFVSLKTEDVDKILHRNRAILQEILGKKKVQIKVNRIVLSKKKFHFKYHTHFQVNKSGKMYYYLYDMAWMEFSDDEILIINR